MEEFPGVTGEDRAAAVFPARLPLHQSHAQPLLHGLDVAPCLPVRDIDLPSRAVDRTVGVYRLEQKASAPAEHRLSFRLYPDLGSDLQAVMTFLHNGTPQKILCLVISAARTGSAQSLAVVVNLPHILDILAALRTPHPPARPSSHDLRSDCYLDDLHDLKAVFVGHYLVRFELRALGIFDMGK